jgi:hypothetical protein
MEEPKVPTVLFLGAGAHAPIGFPTTKQIMKEIGLEPTDTNKLEGVTKETELLQEIYNKLSDNLRDLEGILEFLHIANNPLNFVHIEILNKEIINQISEITVSKLRSIISMDKEKNSRLYEDIKKHLINAYRYFPEKHNEKAEGIYKPLLLTLMDKDNKSLVFGEEADELPIFTTNYDVVFENLNTMRFMKDYGNIIDGFKIEKRTAQYVFSTDVYNEKKSDKPIITLFKLHGSLNWYVEKSTNTIVKFSNLQGHTEDPRYGFPIIVYPADYKPYRREEFYILNERFKQYLINAKRCIVVGFSFRDIGRINRIFEEVMKYSNKDLEVIISDTKKDITELDGANNLFNNFKDRFQYFDGGIRELPKRLLEMRK